MMPLAALFLASTLASPHPIPIVRPKADDSTQTLRFTESGWSFEGRAEITSLYGYFSPPFALALSGPPFYPAYLPASATHRLPFKVGKSYQISAWVNADNAPAGGDLQFVIGSDATTLFLHMADALSDDLDPGWQRVDLGVFVNDGWDPDSLWLKVQDASGGSTDWRWVVGQIEIRQGGPEVDTGQ